MDHTANFFQDFMPHGMCYQWRLDILLSHVVSDIFIALAYFSIPIMMYYFLQKRQDFPFRIVAYMFSVFIFACGVTHVFSVWIVWNGHYGVQGILKGFTAMASIATAIVLFPVIPKLMALRTPKELEKINRALKIEIDNRKSQEEQTIELQAELLHIGRVTTMGQMASSLAHELNQPLTAISQNAATASLMMQNSGNSDEELTECLQEIETDSLRAGEIIHSLRQQMSKDNSSRQSVDLGTLTKQVIKLVKPEARHHNIDLLDSTCTGVNANVNRVQIAQILINLLRNGIQAIAGSNRTEGKIRVSTLKNKNKISVSVEDNGPGINSGIELFKPFETSKKDGMGLGLSISKSIVESHGGKIIAENKSNGGARFVLSLPVQQG